MEATTEKDKSRAERLANSAIARAARPGSRAAKAAAAQKIKREAAKLATSEQPGKAKKLLKTTAALS